MKKRLFIIIISMFLLAANVNATNKIAFAAESSLSTAQINKWDYVKSTRLTRSEQSRIGGAMVHLGHKKFFESPETQRAITYLSLITPIGEGVGLIGNIIRTGAKFLAKQMVKSGGKTVYRAVGAIEKTSINTSKSFLLKEGGAEVKWFAKSLEDAHWYGNRLFPDGYSVIRGTVSPSVNIGRYWYPSVDIGSYVFPGNVLPYIKPILP
ncbi:MAG: hypothetical protein LBK94_10020 [Prevotellaceae bacterium]|jgi:hypothetical protein|nr:hypothetical protein [Prevotellaceae bacterium]